jgi:hypothetical protein
MEMLFWSGVTNEERHPFIDRIQCVISKYGDIIDFKMFSDLSLAIKLEVPETKINDLYGELIENLNMEAFAPLNPAPNVERTVFLNVGFGKGLGDLKITVPSVPG